MQKNIEKLCIHPPKYDIIKVVDLYGSKELKQLFLCNFANARQFQAFWHWHKLSHKNIILKKVGHEKWVS
jgi:hypothetical protein